jgi:hypothetical protein
MAKAPYYISEVLARQNLYEPFPQKPLVDALKVVV